MSGTLGNNQLFLLHEVEMTLKQNFQQLLDQHSE